jgi:hypothetical protein
VKLTYIGLVAIVAIAAVITVFFLIPSPSEENNEIGWIGYEEPVLKDIGGKYNASLILMARLGDYESGDIIYTIDGVERTGWFNSAFENVLSFIKTNTPQDSIILAWWDYGNMIMGFAEREALAINPSEKLLISVTNSSSPIETDPNAILEDIAKVLVANDPDDALNILEKYGAKFVLVPTGIFGDEGKAKWILYASGVSLDNIEEYWDEGSLVGAGMDTLLYQMLNKQDITGFDLIYSDKDARLYRVGS